MFEALNDGNASNEIVGNLRDPFGSLTKNWVPSVPPALFFPPRFEFDLHQVFLFFSFSFPFVSFELL